MRRSGHVAIIGAGPAACAAACSLMPDYEVTLIDPQGPGSRTFRLGESLPAASQRILRELGLWEEFLSQGHTYVRQKKSRWGSNELQIQDSFCNPDGADFLLDRERFENGLLAHVMSRGTRHLPLRLKSISSGSHTWTLTLGDDRLLEADWVIDASGRNAAFARKAGARRIRHNDLVAQWYLGPSAGKEEGSYLQSVENGWWYTSRIPAHGRVVIFFAQSTTLMPAPWQVPYLGQLLERDSFSYSGRPQRAAAHSGSLSRVTGARWHAIGDASLAFDPLSSQGLFHALYTGMKSREVVETGGKNYQEEIDEIFSAYRKHSELYYGLENRWDKDLSLCL